MHLGLERIDNPLFDEPWITPQDGMPLSEYETPNMDLSDVNEVENEVEDENEEMNDD
jgi:hypothetical protein